MNAPNWLQLKQAGDSVTMEVTSCAKATVGKYPEYEIVGNDGNKPVGVKMPAAAFERQIGRAGIGEASALAGRIVNISRGANAQDASKPYWNLDVIGKVPSIVPNGGAASSPAAPAPTQAGEKTPAPSGLAAVFSLQEDCFRHALKLATYAESKGVSVTLEGVSALTAQAMIEASRRGVA